jgi:hypothetical protein
MARTRTLQELRDEARQTVDMADTQFVTDQTWNRWINQGVARVWNHLVRADPLRYVNATPYSLSTTSGTYLYNLETSVPTLLEVVLVSLVRGSDRITVNRFHFQERNRHTNTPNVDVTPWGRTSVHYCLYGNDIDGTGQRIEFRPDPGTNTYEIHYVTRAPELDDDTDAYDGINGFEDYVIEWAARKAARKEESYEMFQSLNATLAEAKAEIEAMGPNRDSGQPDRIQDTYRSGRDHLW